MGEFERHVGVFGLRYSVDGTVWVKLNDAKEISFTMDSESKIMKCEFDVDETSFKEELPDDKYPDITWEMLMEGANPL